MDMVCRNYVTVTMYTKYDMTRSHEVTWHDITTFTGKLRSV